MILEIVKHLDYDHYKSFLPECSELSEEEIEFQLNELIDIAEDYIDE